MGFFVAGGEPNNSSRYPVSCEGNVLAEEQKKPNEKRTKWKVRMEDIDSVNIRLAEVVTKLNNMKKQLAAITADLRELKKETGKL